MKKIYKIYRVILRRLIFCLDGINNHLFTKVYTKYLKTGGVHFDGQPNYISHTAYFDGQGLSKIYIGKDTVISREVMLLTHDYSIETALHSIGEGTEDRHLHINKEIKIGNNCFIGARASLLPGTNIGDNSIIGACCVVKGNIPENSIVIGNPAKIIKETNEYGKIIKDKINVKNY